MQAQFLDAAGAARLPIMGSYGIGVERLLAAVVEAHHDAKGITWPRAIAPYDVQIVALGWEEPAVAEAVAAAEAALERAGLSVLTDDRDERPGVKFNDADLLGIPLRVTLSPRSLERDSVEVRRRVAGSDTELVLLTTAVERLSLMVREAGAGLSAAME